MTDSRRPQTTKSSRKMDGSFRSGKQHPKWFGSKLPELVGQVFGSVTITSSQIHRVKGSLYVEARCSLSGIAKMVCLRNLQNGATTSFFANGKRPILHAKVLGRRYDAIMARCNNPAHRHWHSYGGRGIKSLFTSRMEFILWMTANLPHKNYKGVEIDRVNNDGHYEPGNLRLATRTENTRNRRNTTTVMWRGERMPAIEFVSPYAYTPTCRYAKQGMTGEQIIEQAKEAVRTKRKNWRGIAARLASMT